MAGEAYANPFNVEVAGLNYAVWIASTRPIGGPDADDERFLEIRSAGLEPLLFISHFRTTGRMTLTGMSPELPVELVTWAIARARQIWPEP
jgi:hypothetical protein